MRYHPSLLVLFLSVGTLCAQQAPYINSLPADPPYYRVRYEASEVPGELIFAVGYTVWIPPGVKVLRGVVVHQHGCGEGSCRSGQTGAFDLHWQALAKKHGCALLAPSYEQPEKGNCQMWCDPRNGSGKAFQKGLDDLGARSGHPELGRVPWALWGHSGGGHWVGGMALLHPDRVIAAWLRSGVPQIKQIEGKPTPYSISEAALEVPLMCNLGTKEGVSVREGRFSKVWEGVEVFFTGMRAKGALIGVSVDPLSSHDCGNQRYLAVPWLDACLSVRLPEKPGQPLKAMSEAESWLAPLETETPGKTAPVAAAAYSGPKEKSVWLPNHSVAKAWAQYVRDTAVSDDTPPPAPTGLKVSGNELSWEAEADLESGLAGFIVERDGAFLASLPKQPKNPFGRVLFQNLSYSDTPTQPLEKMTYTDTTAVEGKKHVYRVISVNTVGLKSQ